MRKERIKREELRRTKKDLKHEERNKKKEVNKTRKSKTKIAISVIFFSFIYCFQVLEYWKKRELLVPPLKEVMLSHLEIIAPIFGEILAKGKRMSRLKRKSLEKNMKRKKGKRVTA